MYEIRIEESGREVHRQMLSEGQYHLGRSSDNEISVASPGVSRQHLRFDITSERVTITDLGSTNGTQLNGQQLVPHQAHTWHPRDSVHIGLLIMRIQPQTEIVEQRVEPEQAERPLDQPPVQLPPSATTANLVHTVVSPNAIPQITTLSSQVLFAGRDQSCAIRLAGANIAAHHCRIQMLNGRVEVTNLDGNLPAVLAGNPLPVGRPTEWQVNESLQVGSAVLHLTLSPAGSQTVGAQTGGRTPSSRSLWTYGLFLLLAAGLFFVCLAAVTVVLVQRDQCATLSPSCLISAFEGGLPAEALSEIEGRATPTLAPVQAGPVAPTREDVIEFSTATPVSVVEAVDCDPDSSGGTGWLELPFPYQGTDPVYGGSAELFRRISQRSRFGGRLNAFFDHEFPVYPPAFGGREPEDRAATLVTFNGARSLDAYAQDSDDSDWYSGHSGIDFSPARPREATTPVLAAAAGRLLLAEIDDDGNHMVWLDHDPDGDGRYQYATLYFHLEPDDHFFAMTTMEEKSPISAGQRIGTMGTTGRSSGIHLHFEVRHDVDGNRRFTIFERIDPYGFFPSDQIPVDPWSALTSWIDARGDSYEHLGVASEYLWIHPLIDVVDTTGECTQISGDQLDLNLYPVLGFGVVNPGFTYIARNEQGEILREGPPHRRTITVLPENLDGLDIESVSLEFLDPVLNVPITINEERSFERRETGAYVFSAVIRKTGRYVLVAKEVVDRVPPITVIELTGNTVAGKPDTYDGSVLVTLDPSDRGLIQSTIREVQYSLDCGRTWNLYTEPFEVTPDTPHACGESGSGLQGIELEQNDFILLAMSEDSENNIEQPPAQVRFKVE